MTARDEAVKAARNTVKLCELMGDTGSDDYKVARALLAEVAAHEERRRELERSKQERALAIVALKDACMWDVDAYGEPGAAWVELIDEECDHADELIGRTCKVARGVFSLDESARKRAAGEG